MRWPDVVAQATLAVASRATQIGADAVHDQGEEMDLSGVDLPFRRLDMPLQNVSATAVRAQVGAGGGSGALGGHFQRVDELVLHARLLVAQRGLRGLRHGGGLSPHP